MKIVIAGASAIGSHLARLLSRSNQDIVLIDHNADTLDEITGCAAAMRDHALHVEHNFDVLEIVGTGGDHSDSFNISTIFSHSQPFFS